MKPGIYRVSFNVELKETLNLEDSRQAVAQMISDDMENDEFPELELELLEEFELDYLVEEDNLEELDF